MAVLIPARSGSKRIPNKNVQIVGTQRLVEIAVQIAKNVESAANVYVSTNSEEIRQICIAAGALSPTLRPEELAQDDSLDIDWLMHAISEWGIKEEFICILRPTSPFIESSSLQGALESLSGHNLADSVRAIRKVTEHPGKMWRMSGSQIIPLFPQITTTTPSHSRPTQTLEPVYVQSGGFEIMRATSLLNNRSISGNYVLGYLLKHPESIDINTESELALARQTYEALRS